MRRLLLLLPIALGVSCYPHHPSHAQGYPPPGYGPPGGPPPPSLLLQRPFGASIRGQPGVRRGELRNA